MENTARFADQNRIFWRVWSPVFVALQVVAVAVISSIEPEGFDRCVARPSASEQRVQMVVAAISIVVPLAVAIVALRGRYLLLCCGVVILPGLFWLVLLRPDSQVC